MPRVTAKVSWREFENSEPDLARRVRRRFEVGSGLAMLATVRSDGWPRVSALEPPLFGRGEIWLGMMEGSRKAADLIRDGRLALHAPALDREVREGDAKLSGVAVDASARFDEYLGAADDSGTPLPPGPYPVFVVGLTMVSFLLPAGDHLRIDVWTPGGGLRVVDRY